MRSLIIRFITACFWGFAVFCISTTAYALDVVWPAALEVSLESRWIAWEIDDRHSTNAHELEAGLGLAWDPNAWVSLHGRVSLGWNAVLDEPFSYRFHNDSISTSNLANIEVAAFMDVHPFIPVVTIRAELSASSYFVRNRAGIWLINAGIGIGSQPFIDYEADLRTVYFGIICRFPIYDEFEKVFFVKRKMPQLGLQVTWGF